MSTSDKNQIIKEMVEEFLKNYPAEIRRKIATSRDASNSALTIDTSFQEPYLDVSIEINGSDFVANYSNENYSEHWFKDDALPAELADKICLLLKELIEVGAVQTDKVAGGKLYSSTTLVGKIDETTSVKRFSIFRKKQTILKKYPPFSHSVKTAIARKAADQVDVATKAARRDEAI
jgi:hypothetical protein